MPYCPKCGVEVNPGIAACPLCACDIPRFADEEDDCESMFPVAENIYYRQLLQAKKQIYMGIGILLLGAVLTLFSVHVFAGLDSRFVHYGIAAVIGIWFYLFFLFGFLRNIFVSVAGIGAVSVVLVLVLDLIDKHLTWALDVGLPVTLLLTVILLASVKLYKRFRHKNQIVIIPIYMFTGTSLFCLGLECILDLHFQQSIRLGWSVIVLFPLLSLAAVLFVLYATLPERGREKVRRKLHF